MTTTETVVAVVALALIAWVVTAVAVKIECWWRYRRSRGQIIERFRP